ARTLAKELWGTQEPTHLGRMLQDLGITYIAAHSPQAKGRIERLWATLQDRPAVNWGCAASPPRAPPPPPAAAAPQFPPAFITDYNQRFARPAADAAAVWRRPPRELDQLLSCRYSRVIARDNTVRLGVRWLQLPPGPRGRSHAGRRVELRELLDGRLLALANGAVLAAQASPSPAFILVPHRAPSMDRPRNGRPPTLAPAQLAQDRRSPPPLKSESPRKSPAARSRRPAHAHPWSRSIR